MIRSFLAAAVVIAGALGMGSDLMRTAWDAAHTAQVVVLPPNS